MLMNDSFIERQAKRRRRLIRYVKPALMAMALACQFHFPATSPGQEPQPKAQNPAGRFSLRNPYGLPDPQRVSRLDTETTLRDRMTKDSKIENNPLGLKYEIQFPDYPPPPKPGLVARQWPPMTETVDPAFVCYR